MKLSIAYSPDADDAFMFYALESGRLKSPVALSFTQLDTEKLNRKALAGVYDISAVSVALLAKIWKSYRLLPHGASVGDNYGPVVVCPKTAPAKDWKKKVVAIPGKNTTAALVLDLLHPSLKTLEVPIAPFSEAFACLFDGRAGASLLIHEGRLTYEKEDCRLLEDIGKSWFSLTGLPLPLGANVIRASLPESLQEEMNQVLKESIRLALEEREAAIDWILEKNLGNLKEKEAIERYLNLYANDDTLAYSKAAVAGMKELFRRARQQGMIEETPDEAYFEEALSS
jgi:1,4-dihydroxy-6-naphthoate synthase